MTGDKRGFSLLEILIAVAILGIVMAMNCQLFQDLIFGQRQQGALVTGQFETSLGLEMLRNDLGNAGFGLADEFQNPLGTYTEATSDPAQQFNSAPNVPRAIAHHNNVGGSFSDYVANSDYLVIRSPAVGMNSAAGKWTNITGTTVHIWNDVNLDMVNGQDYMIVIKPPSEAGGTSQLIVSSGAYSLQYITSTLNAAFQPSGTGGRYLAFGIEDSVAPTMPFNRADYFVKKVPAGGNPNCAPGTGILYKAIVKHGPAGTGGATEECPLVDCVANMQVVFRLDTNLDGVPDQTVNDISGLDALSVRRQVREVQIYILAQDGIMDRRFTYAGANPVTLGPSVALGRSVDLAGLVGTDWNHYRWKVYTLFVKPKSFY